MIRTADFSPCGRYRYRLSREWASGKRVCGLLLNPSKASNVRDDSTASTFVSFSKRWGCGGFSIVNLFGLIATDPMALVTDPEPVGPDNDRFIVETVAAADLVVCAWGTRVPTAHAARAAEVLALLGTVPLWCLGTTANGSPKHPLRIAHATPLVPFRLEVA